MPEASDALAKEVVALRAGAARGDLFKSPGVAETLDWATALSSSTPSRSIPQTVNDTLGVLLKYQDDIARMQGTEAKRILDQIKDEIRTMAAKAVPTAFPSAANQNLRAAARASWPRTSCISRASCARRASRSGPAPCSMRSTPRDVGIAQRRAMTSTGRCTPSS